MVDRRRVQPSVRVSYARQAMTIKEKLAMALNYALFLGLGAWAIWG